jgi:hypothetical protein
VRACSVFAWLICVEPGAGGGETQLDAKINEFCKDLQNRARLGFCLDRAKKQWLTNVLAMDSSARDFTEYGV